MLSYKKYIAQNLLENEDSKDLYNKQMDEFKKLEEKKIVSTTPLEDGLYRITWDHESQGLYFQCNLRINPSFKGSSFEELPFKIGRIEGNFKCYGADTIVSLKGSPQGCKDFEVFNCNLKSLEGSPEWCSNFNVSDNLIKNIKGGPKYLFGDFNLENNLITNLDFGPLIITGSCRFIGNRNIINNNQAKLFASMHRKITHEFMMTGNNYGVKTNLENAIKDGSYVVTLLVENPEYAKLLGNFKDQIDNLDYIKGAKDFGII